MARPVRAAGACAASVLLGWLLILAAVGFKISLVPFHLWTPDVYQGAPIPITALLATGSKGAVVAALLAAYAGAGAALPEQTSLLWILAAITMVIGTLSALWQNNVKRLFAYSSMVHMGYVLIGLISGTIDGYRSVAFYLVVYTAASLGSFAILTSFANRENEPEEINDMRGAGYLYPVRSGLLAFFLLSLAGLPPAAGFVGKFGLFMAAIDTGYIGLTLIGIFASVVSVYYYLRIVMVMFAADADQPAISSGSISESTVLLVCGLVTAVFGLYPGPLLDLVQLIF
jgi:NADH-quinone oxidoreductase subunit N